MRGRHSPSWRRHLAECRRRAGMRHAWGWIRARYPSVELSRAETVAVLEDVWGYVPWFWLKRDVGSCEGWDHESNGGEW